VTRVSRSRSTERGGRAGGAGSAAWISTRWTVDVALTHPPPSTHRRLWLIPCSSRERSSAPQDEREVPGQHLAQAGHGRAPAQAAGVVARVGGHDVHARAVVGPAQGVGGPVGEQRLAEPVLRLVAVLARVPAAGPLPPEVVPRRRLVTAPRRQPRRE